MRPGRHKHIAGLFVMALAAAGCTTSSTQEGSPAVLPVLPRHLPGLAAELPTGLVEVTVEQSGQGEQFSGRGTIDLDTCEGSFSGGGLEWQRSPGGREIVRSDGAWYDLSDDRAPVGALSSLFHVITRAGDLEQRGPLCSLNILPALVYGPGRPGQGGVLYNAASERVEAVLLAGIGRKLTATAKGDLAALEAAARERAAGVLAGLGDLRQRSILVERPPGGRYRITEEWPGTKVVFEVAPVGTRTELQEASVSDRERTRITGSGTAAAGTGSVGSEHRAGSALIGDSITAKSLPFIDPMFTNESSGVGPIYARSGFSVYELLEYDAVPLETLPSTVILALGTVDMRMQTPVRQREYAIELLNRLGPSRRILWIDTLSAKGKQFEQLPVTHRIPDVPHIPYNSLLAALVSEYPNVEIVSWSRYAADNGVALWDDGIHYLESGYRKRADFLGEVLRGS